jgi:hypothetical protein
MTTVLTHEFTCIYACLNGRYNISFFLLIIKGTSLLKTRVLKELFGISVVNISSLRLVFDSTSILAAW